MSNVDRVAEVIDGLLDVATEWDQQWAVARDLARALSAAGYIAPDLPDPSRGMITPSGHIWYLSGPVGDIRANRDLVVAFGMWQEEAFRIVTDPDKAEEIGLAFLAAARHARNTKENHDDQ